VQPAFCWLFFVGQSYLPIVFVLLIKHNTPPFFQGGDLGVVNSANSFQLSHSFYSNIYPNRQPLNVFHVG